MITDLICLGAKTACKCLLRFREYLVGWWLVIKAREFGFARNFADHPHRMMRRLVVSLLVPLCALVVVAQGQDAVAPAKEEAAPAQDTATPAKDAAAPAKDKSAPTKDEAAPTKDEAAPAKDDAAQAKDETAPVKEGAAPAKDETVPPVDAAAPAPIESPSAPAQEEEKPAPEVSAPAQDTAAPAPEVPAPVDAPAVPAKEEATPTAEVATPAQDTAAPTPEATAPVQTEAPAAPAPAAAPAAPTIIEAAAPTPEVPAPVEAPAVPAKKEVTKTAEVAPTAEVAAPAQDAIAPAPEAVPPAPSIMEAPAPTPEAVAPVPVEAPSAPAPIEAPIAPAPETVAPAPSGAPGVAIDRFEFSYGLEHPALPPLDELKGLTVQSTRDGHVFRAPAASGAENLTLNAIPAGSRFDADILRGIAQDVVRWYNRRGLFGVWVAYSDLETSATGLVDNRPADNHAARLTIWASQISEVRTLARGQRIKQQFSINNPKHRGIISHSPLHPGETPEQSGSLFNQDALDEYLYGLSLHPGRRVEASIASAGQPGKVVLDYLVTESKSWQIFSQANNYGTESTGQYRLRLGFQHNQLTNHDDIFNIDAISTPDAKTYGTFLSYRIPILRPARLLLRVFGSYGDFIASDASIENLRFAGNNWLGGLELTNHLTLWRNWQLVSVLGAQYNHYGINSRISNIPLVSGQSDFLVPYLGATLTRNAGWWAVTANLRFDHTLSGIANEDPTTGIPALGRLFADADWTSARWNLSGTVYLDSLFRRDAKFQALAHEATLRVKGRVLLRGERLIPHEQEPMGGALSIRGYPESVISADEFYATTFEYAWHIPRMLKPGEPGKFFRWPFKWRPVQAGQNSDWDLSVRAFFDYGHRAVTPIPPDPRIPVDPNNPVITPLVDRNLNMAGFGGGITLLVKQNFSLRADYGVALNELRDDTRPEGQQVVLPKGNSQVYLVTSFSW